jgi:hypothetical protein
MNFAFELQKDKDLRENELFPPYVLLNIWNLMEVFDAGKLLGTIYRLWSFCAPSGSSLGGRVYPLRDHEENKRLIEFICAELSHLGLAASLASARELRDILNLEVKERQEEIPPLGRCVELHPQAADQYYHHVVALINRLKDELSAKMIMTVPSGKVGYFDGSNNAFPLPIQNNFPSAEYDMEEAGKCFALGRYTASVFHLMRILEVGLNTMATSLGLTVAPNWNRAITDIENEIASRSYATHPGWRVDEPFYSEAATHFRLVKNAWRNHTMHIKEKYDEERARDIFNSVSAFMRHLATKLHE